MPTIRSKNETRHQLIFFIVENLFTFTKANVIRTLKYKIHFNPAALSALKRILVASLNWGLGHSARCVPLIAALEGLGMEVLLASDGAALNLLRAEFPHLPAFSLPSYGIRYDGSNMVLNIGRQLPRIFYAVRAEQWATERLVQAHGIDGILSDNRYGCFSRQTQNVFLTHQLHLKVPGRALQWAANQALRMALNKFDAVWVPDDPLEPSLSGMLSHPPLRDHAIRYIGPLSRLQSLDRQPEYDVAVVLSGPEPQRSILEARLLEQAMSLPQKFIFVQGRTQAKEHHYVAENIEVVSYLTSREVSEVMAATDVVVCRSGYSSIMDLAAIGKRAILIPTPGQTEQEYLADFLAEKEIFLAQPQEKVDLGAGLQQLSATRGFGSGACKVNTFQTVLEEWVRPTTGP